MAGLTSQTVLAQSANPFPGKVTGMVALTSEYMLHGITQTEGNPAVQGSIDWDTGSGIVLGLWGSSVNFNDGNQATTELDVNADYRGTYGNLFYSVGAGYYFFPGAPTALDYDIVDLRVRAGYNFGVAVTTIGVSYIPDGFSTRAGDAINLSTGITVPLTSLLRVSARVGHNILMDGRKNRTNWNIGTTLKVYDWFEIDARYYDSDIHFLGDLADDRFVLSVSRVF